MLALSLDALHSSTMPFVISAAINLLACALFGGYFLFQRRQKPEIRWFALYNLCVAAWSLFYLLWQLSETADAATLFTRLLMAFATLLPLLYLLFTLRFLKRRLLPWGVPLLYILFGGFFFLCLFTDRIVGGISPRGGFPFWPVAGPLLSPLLLLWFGVILTTLALLAKAALHVTSRRQKGQIVVLLLGNLIAYAGGATNFFLWYDIPILPWGNSAALALPLATLYAVAAYHLFDLRLFIKKTLIYSGLLLFVLLIYTLSTVIMVSLAGQRTLPSRGYMAVTSLFVLLLGLGFRRLDRWTNALLDRTLFRLQREQEAILQRLAAELHRTGDLEAAMQVVLREGRETFGLRRAAAILWEEGTEGETSVARLHIWQSGYPNPQILTAENLQPLYASLDSSESEVDRKSVSQLTAFSTTALTHQVEREESQIQKHPDRYDGAAQRRHAVRKMLTQRLARLGAEVVVPLRGENGLRGVLLLGSREQGEAFTPEMLTLFDLVAAQTVTAIQKARLLEEDRMKGEFVKVAAHELIAPIAAMDGYLAMVLDERRRGAEIDAEARKSLVNTQNSIHRLRSLVQEMLSEARIESGRISFSLQAVDAAALVHDALMQLRFIAQAKGLELRFDPPRQIPAVYADPDRLMEVLINLLSNAIKYTLKGHVEVIIAPYSQDRQVRITVRDSGLGITRAAIGRLFQRFSRIETAETMNIPGTGLGLHITKSLVEGMGGTITVTSRVGKGSAFTVVLAVASCTGSGREGERLTDHWKQDETGERQTLHTDKD